MFVEAGKAAAEWQDADDDDRDVGNRAIYEPDGNAAFSGQGTDSGVSQAAARAGGLPLHPASRGKKKASQLKKCKLSKL